MLPTKYWFIWQSVSEENIFLEINQSETRIVLYKERSFRSDPFKNMAATDNSCF
jgi:hypothetical protein